MKYNYTAILPDEKKTSSFGLVEDALFDKIINLRFVLKDKNGKYNSFVVRSDFEAERTSPNSNFYNIHKCIYKPSITLRLDRPSPYVSTGIELTLDNFYLLQENGERLATITKENIVRIDVMAGYFNQFNRLPHSSIEDLFNFEDNYGVAFLTLWEGGFYVTIDSIAPNSSVRIHGYLGLAPFGIGTKEDGEREKVSAYLSGISAKGSKQEAVTYENLKKDLIKSDISLGSKSAYLADILTERINRIEDKLKKQNKLGKQGSTDSPSYNIYFTDNLIQAGEEQKNLEDSEGNIVELVQTNPELEANTETGAETISSVINTVKLQDSNLAVIYLDSGDIIIGMEKDKQSLTDIALAYNKAKEYYQSEARKKKYRETVLSQLADKTYPGKTSNLDLLNSLKTAKTEASKDELLNKIIYRTEYIPAVYNISIDATVNIVCPFYTFVNVFNLIRFNYRYNKSRLVEFYIERAKSAFKSDKKVFDNVFWIFSYKIAFATSDDVNETELSCVSYSEASEGLKELKELIQMEEKK